MLLLAQSAPLWLAAAVTGTVTVLARLAGSLSRSGAVAAFVVGLASLVVGFGWGLFLICWFGLASVLSRIGRARKAARVGRIVEKTDQRDAWQVMANGGVFFVAALAEMPGLWTNLASGAMAPSWLPVAAAGALAAAGADTWATEVGTLVGGTPWSFRTLRSVPAGTSGAISWAGSLAMLAGAAALAALACAFQVVATADFLAVALGGLAGALTDSGLGAWVQSRRWCAACTMETEQRVHGCGTITSRIGGLGRLGNDGVNLLCTATGAVVAAGLSR